LPGGLVAEMSNVELPSGKSIRETRGERKKFGEMSLIIHEWDGLYVIRRLRSHIRTPLKLKEREEKSRKEREKVPREPTQGNLRFLFGGEGEGNLPLGCGENPMPWRWA